MFVVVFVFVVVVLLFLGWGVGLGAGVILLVKFHKVSGFCFEYEENACFFFRGPLDRWILFGGVGNVISVII